MTATEPNPMATTDKTEYTRFTEFRVSNPEFSALLVAAEASRDGVAYGAMADWLEENGETEWATYFRTCCRGEEYGLTIDGSTYHTFPASGYQGRTVYDVNRSSPKMRNRFGQSEYVYSAAELVRFFTVVRQRAEAKTGRKAKEKAAKDEARRQPNPFKVGDILHYSFGYDCTINKFAQVVGVKGQTVTVRGICKKQVGDGWRTGCHVGPDAGNFTGEPETLRLVYSAWGDKASVSLPVKGHKGKHWRKVDAGYTMHETDD